MAERIPRLNKLGMFTQLDANGNFIGRTVTRREAETTKGNIPVARVLLFSPDRSKVLLQQRGNKPLWGGRFDASTVETSQMSVTDPWELEHPKTTAERGLQEELAISAITFDQRQYQDTWEGSDYPMKSFITTYTAVYNGPVTPSEEVAHVAWIDTNLLPKMVANNPKRFTPSLVEFVNTHPELFY